MLYQSSVPLLRGLHLCLMNSSGLRSEMSTSPDFWSILRELSNLPEAALLVFRVVEDLCSSPGGITADNYEAAIAVLNDFATAGSVGAALEQRRDREAHGSRRGRGQHQQ